MIFEALALLGMASAGSGKSPRVIGEAEARRLPGWKASDLFYENDNIVAELEELVERGDCKSFVARYTRFYESIRKAASLVNSMETPSPVDQEGVPWFSEKSQHKNTFRQFAKIAGRFREHFDQCELGE